MTLFSYDRGVAHQYVGWSQRKSVSIDTDGIVYRRRYCDWQGGRGANGVIYTTLSR